MRHLLPSLSPFHASAAFRYLFFAQLISSFGSALTYVVLPFEMYRLTKSTALVGLLGVVEFVPMFLLAFAGGALADHFERKRLILWAESAMLLVCLLLTVNAAQAQPALWPLWVAAALLAGLNSLHRPAMEALTPQLLPASEMTAVAAWQSLRGNFTHIIGPALAGLLAATYGAQAAFGINALTYLLSLLMIARVTGIPALTPPEESLTWVSLLEGWRYARTRPDLLGTYLIDLNAMFFGMPNALFPAIAERWGAATLGMLYAAPSVGALFAALTSGWARRVHRHGLAITLAATLWGVGIIGFGLAAQLWVALSFLAVAGAADMISGVFRMTIWNQTIPAHLRGRMAGIEMVSYLSGPYLGNAEAGFAAKLFGLQVSVVSGGVLCVLGSGLLALLLPKFIRYDSRLLRHHR
ncbi:MAG: MFS transporter [Bryobacteraceae bacterium]|nr:MFS transporter [Bryobacteraceae bacterium]